MGSKTKSYLNLNVWLEMIYERIEHMDDGQAVAHAFHAAEILLNKMQNLPSSPEDSKSNADRALDELKAAEAYGLRNTGAPNPQPGSHGADVGTGPA